jgi:hypothetical protein
VFHICQKENGKQTWNYMIGILLCDWIMVSFCFRVCFTFARLQFDSSQSHACHRCHRHRHFSIIISQSSVDQSQTFPNAATVIRPQSRIGVRDILVTILYQDHCYCCQ